MLRLNRLLALWAAHEAERDPQGRPLVLEQLQDAVGVEDVATLELDGGLLMQLTSVADTTELFLAGQIGPFDALWLQTG